MLNILLSLAILVWFFLLYGVAQQALATVARAPDGPLVMPIALIATVAFMPLVFVVERKDGQAILEEGLTASNVMLVTLAGLTGLYLTAYVLRQPRLLSVPFSGPYLPFTLMIGMDGLSVFWSVVPAYTAYRAVELSIFYLASILIFDRSDIERRLADFLAIFVVIWLVAISPTVVTNLMSGIVFSSGKNNMMPFVCAALAFLVAFDRRQPRRGLYALLALIGFIVAGSASSTGALIAVVPGIMIASSRRSVRILGIVMTLITVTTFLGLMLTISMFPDLLEVASAVLQKPAEELANGTGRNNFWPIFLEATRDRLVGSGYSAGDRFLDVIIAKSTITSVAATQNVGLASAHNMFLSAWAGLGLIGLCFTGVVLVGAIRWGLKIEEPGRRFVISSILMLILNGMTTPGIFQDWNINTLAFVAILAYARIGVMRRTVQSLEHQTSGPVCRADWHMA